MIKVILWYVNFLCKCASKIVEVVPKKEQERSEYAKIVSLSRSRIVTVSEKMD